MSKMPSYEANCGPWACKVEETLELYVYHVVSAIIAYHLGKMIFAFNENNFKVVKGFKVYLRSRKCS